MNVADEVILSIPTDVERKLWGVDKGPTNVMIQIEDDSMFNVSLSESKGLLFFFHGWSNVVKHLRLTRGSLVVIPECILVKNNDYSSNDVIFTVMIDNKTFHVIIETADGKVGFTVGLDVIVSQLQLEAGSFLLFTKYFGNFFHLKFFRKNGVEMNFPDVEVDEADVTPIDAVNDVDEQPDGGVLQFVRMAGQHYFRLPDPVSRMARLDEGLKDITVRLMHLDPPQQFTNGTRRERNNESGFRYALTRWSKFMKSARIKVGDTVHFSFDENDQVLSVEKVVP
ncbi:putative transcription factor B3-Domain family [Helianthus annuus]|nr:putative transcription factor B3-Domain family [Helianthus annuus]